MRVSQFNHPRFTQNARWTALLCLSLAALCVTACGDEQDYEEEIVATETMELRVEVTDDDDARNERGQSGDRAETSAFASGLDESLDAESPKSSAQGPIEYPRGYAFGKCKIVRGDCTCVPRYAGWVPIRPITHREACEVSTSCVGGCVVFRRSDVGNLPADWVVAK